MGQIVAVPLGFALIIILINRKVSIGTAMFTASAVMGLTAGFGIAGTLNICFKSLISKTTLELLAITTLICIIGHLLYYYKVLDKMVDALENLFRSVHLIIMLIPSIMGALFIPGGAILSAPIVDNLGDRLKITGVRKSAINMVFRHSWFFIFPFSTAMILASRMGDINIYDLIKINASMTVIMVVTGYLLYLRNCPATEIPEKKVESAGFLIKTGNAVLYTSPIWAGIVLNVFFEVPFYLALIPGIIITYFLIDNDKKDFLKKSYEGIKFNMLYAVAGIMVLQGFIKEMTSIKQMIDFMANSGIAIEVIMIIAAVFVGFSTSSNPAVIGMLYPVFLPLAPDYHIRVMYAFLIFVSGFICYYVSPLHLCQVFTAEYFDIEVKELYKEYRILLPVLFVSMLIIYFVLK